MPLIGAYHKQSGQWCATSPIHDSDTLLGEPVPVFLLASVLSKTERECGHQQPIAWRMIDDGAPASMQAVRP